MWMWYYWFFKRSLGVYKLKVIITCGENSNRRLSKLSVLYYDLNVLKPLNEYMTNSISMLKINVQISDIW